MIRKKKSSRKGQKMRKKRPIAYHTCSAHSGKAAASPGCMLLLLLQARLTADGLSLAS